MSFRQISQVTSFGLYVSGSQVEVVDVVMCILCRRLFVCVPLRVTDLSVMEVSVGVKPEFTENNVNLQ